MIKRHKDLLAEKLLFVPEPVVDEDSSSGEVELNEEDIAALMMTSAAKKNPGEPRVTVKSCVKMLSLCSYSQRILGSARLWLHRHDVIAQSLPSCIRVKTDSSCCHE